MKRKPYIKYKNGEIRFLEGYSISHNIITLHYDQNGSIPITSDKGFQIYDANDNLIIDGTDYIYRWDTLNEKNPTQPFTVAYATHSNFKQKYPYMTQDEAEQEAKNIPVEPLTNEELTSTIAELLYETSLMQLGMEVE